MKLTPRHTLSCSILGHVILACSIAFVLLLTVAPKFSFAQSNNYSCGDSSSGHCYGEYRWWGGMNGAMENISVPFLGGISSNGFQTWEVWVGQFNNSGCSDQNNDCWVEAGIITGGVLGTYFWADERPNGGFNLHYTNQVGPDDHEEHFEIYRQNSQTWNISASVSQCGSNGTCSSPWGGTSTANNYSPDHIDIGVELAGTYGQPSRSANWQNNFWRCGNNWCKQSGLGNPGSGFQNTPNSPCNAYWVTPPQANGNTGNMSAYC